MNIHKITIPTPYPVGDVNAYLVRGDALTLFDAGPKTEQGYEALKAGIEGCGFQLQDVEQVVLTHHHPDHAGWIDAFPHANILGHKYVDHWLRQESNFLSYEEEFYRQQMKLQGVPQPFINQIIKVRGEIEQFGSLPLTQFLVEGDEVPGHIGLKVYETPGHAQSHLIFVDEKSKKCIGGDLLLERVSSNPLVEPPVDLSFDRPRSLLQYNDSLKRIRDMEVSVVYGGHGGEVTNATALVNERLEKQHQRAMKVYDMMEGDQTAFELTMKLFPKMYMKQPGLTASETLGQLDYLVAQGKISEQVEDGINIYRKI